MMPENQLLPFKSNGLTCRFCFLLLPNIKLKLLPKEVISAGLTHSLDF